MKLSQCRFNYTWVIVGVSFFLVLITQGFAAGYRGLYLAAVTDGLQIPRSLFSISESCRFVADALVSVFFGRLFQRFGARKLVSIGFVTMIGALLLYASTDQVIWFCAAGAMLGVGCAFVGTTVVVAVVRQWCRKNVGTVIGIVLAASGLGSAIGSQIMSPILYDPGNPLGFRNAYRLTAVVLAVSALVIIPLLREKRENVEDKKQPVLKEKSRGKLPKNKVLLCVVIVCVFLCAVSVMGVNSIYSAHMKDRGLTPAAVAAAAGVLSVALIASKILVGRMFDRFGLRPVLLLCQCATLTGFMLLLTLNGSTTKLAVLFAVIFAFALPLETIVVPLIVSDLFPGASYNRILGILTAANSAGFALAPPIANWFYDGFGNYNLVIWGCAGIMVLILLAFQWIIADAHRKKRVLQNQ
jgi:MFS family permease